MLELRAPDPQADPAVDIAAADERPEPGLQRWWPLPVSAVGLTAALLLLSPASDVAVDRPPTAGRAPQVLGWQTSRPATIWPDDLPHLGYQGVDPPAEWWSLRQQDGSPQPRPPEPTTAPVTALPAEPPVAPPPASQAPPTPAAGTATSVRPAAPQATAPAITTIAPPPTPATVEAPISVPTPSWGLALARGAPVIEATAAVPRADATPAHAPHADAASDPAKRGEATPKPVAAARAAAAPRRPERPAPTPKPRPKTSSEPSEPASQWRQDVFRGRSD